ALHVVVRDFDHALRTQRLPAQVLAAIPSAGAAGHALARLFGFLPVTPRVTVERSLAQRRELLHELLAHDVAERRGDADVMERAVVIVEAEQERADHRARAVLVPAKARDDAVGRARVLDLDHRALARLVRRVEPLGHDAVEPRAFEALEPVLGERAILRGR